jgi:hypothetical protein
VPYCSSDPDRATQERRHVLAETYGRALTLALRAIAFVAWRLVGLGGAWRGLFAGRPGVARRALVLPARLVPFA